MKDKMSDKMNEMFAQARFEVEDNDFTKRVVSNLPFIVTVDKKAIWRESFSQVVAVVAVVMFMLVVVVRNLDFTNFSTRIIDKTEQIGSNIADRLNNDFIYKK